jgi:hypothetical protein
MKSGARREVEQGLTAFVHNSEFSLGRAAFGKNVDIDVGGSYFRAEF